MKWFRMTLNTISNWIISKRRRILAKFILEGFDGKVIEFELSELLYVGYDEGTNCIVISLTTKPPIYLPLTGGNYDFLKFISPYFRQKTLNDPKVAVENIGMQSNKKM